MSKVLPIPAFKDNYIWALFSQTADEITVVDPGDALPVLDFLRQHNCKLNAILVTHHHWDHTGGVAKLLKTFPNINVYGPETITGINYPVKNGSEFKLPSQDIHFKVINIPGHTLDHIAYIGNNMLFCGDTLFSAGCGRIFEGTPQQMHDSLQKLMQLPDDMQVFCGHEYTLNNLQFAKTIEPNNSEIDNHISYITNILNSKQPSLPSNLLLEKAINPFLRCHEISVKEGVEKQCGQLCSDKLDVFKHLRRLKDQY